MDSGEAEKNTNGPAEGGSGGSHTEPPVAPPGAAPPIAKPGLAQALLIAAGFASIGAFLAFLLGCLGDGSELAVEIGILLAVLAIILDAVGAQTLGGHGGSHTEPPVAPPSFASLTIASVTAALGLLAVLLDCVMEQSHGGAVTWAGLVLLLISAIADFMAASNVSKGAGTGE